VRGIKESFLLSFLLVVPVLLVACAGQGTEATVAVEGPALEERTEFDGFGFSIAHPAGWSAASNGPVTVITEQEADLEAALQGSQEQAQGIGVSLDHRALPFLRSIGLPEDASLSDLYAMNASFFGWPDDLDVTETEVFGAPALAVTVPEGENWTHALMGFVAEEAFLLVLTAPSEEALKETKPTWERMLASIEAVNP
jgi:hypothetical protein